MTNGATQSAAKRRESASIRVEPLGAVLDVRDGETLLQAAWRQGFYWPSICLGEGRCGLCSVEVIEGPENLGRFERNEAMAIKLLMGPRADQSGRRLRLACCVRPTGDAIVVKRGVRHVDATPREDQAAGDGSGSDRPRPRGQV